MSAAQQVRPPRRRTAAPFRLTRVVTDEDTLHEAVVKALRVLLPPSVVWNCFPAGNIPLPADAKAKLVRFGLQPGWPDLILAYGGYVRGIELKREGGRLSKTRLVRTPKGRLREVVGQAEVFPKLIDAGFASISVCTSVDGVLDELARLGIPLRIARERAA